MYKRRIRNLCVLLVLVMLLELTPAQLLGNWVQHAYADEIPEEYRGFEFEIPQESENCIDVEAPPTFINVEEETPENTEMSSDPLVIEDMTDMEQLDEEMSTLADGTGSETTEGVDPFLGAPYVYNSGENETVSLNTGALILEYTDYVLPGKNGLDLVIGRRYNSQDAALYTHSVRQSWCILYYVYCYRREDVKKVDGTIEDGTDILVKIEECDSRSQANAAASAWEVDVQSKENDDGTTSYFYQTVDVKQHWYEGGTPYTARDPHDYFQDLYGLGYGWTFMFSSIEGNYLHLANGATYSIRNLNKIDGYELDDMVLNYKDDSFSNGLERSRYSLTYQNGRQEYFNSSGELIGIQDKYNNTITLVHTEENDLPKIIITDTLDREIVISGQASDQGHIMTVALPENISLTYEINNWQSEAALASYTDSLENSTHYSYSPQTTHINLVTKNLSDSHVTYNTFMNLNTITHPTGAQTVYSYEIVRRNAGYVGSMEEYRLSSRADLIGETEYNRQEYSYSPNDYTGYPDIIDPRVLPQTYTYYTTVTNADGLATTTTFNKKNQQIMVEVCKGTEKIQITEYTYNSYDLPITETVYTYSPTNQETPMVATTLKTYDNKGNVLTSTSSLADGNAENLEYRTINEYGDYGLLLSQTYKPNFATTVKVENFLDTTDTHIVRTETSVNGVLTQKIEYDYEMDPLKDSYGNIIKQRYYHDDMQTFDEFQYTYSNGAYLSQETFGTLVLNSYGYDTLGRMTSHTDGNGNTTLYAYDALGNVTQITHPDNTTVTYARDYLNNSLTVTDENGAQVKYTYTPLGLEYETIDVQTGSVISRKEYDTQSRLSTLSEFVYGSVTYYFYDVLGRVTRELVWQAISSISDTQYTYDDAAENGTYRKVTKTVMGDSYAPDVVTTEYTDKHGNLVKTGRFLNGTEYFDTYTYDYVGNLLTQKTAADAQKSLPYTVKYEYNENSQVVKTYNSANQYTTNTYNALGQLTASTDYAGTPTTYTYDGLGRLLSQTITVDEGETVTSRYEYDGCGNIIREWKPVQAVGATERWSKTDYAYDSRGNLILVEQYDNEAELSSTAYTYDGVGNLLTMTVGGNTTTYTYDRYGNVLTEQDAMGQTASYTYSATGKPVSYTNRNGVTTTYAYDALGQLRATSAGNDHIYRDYTRTGQVRTEESNWQRTSYTYDSLGRVLTVSEQELSVTDGSAGSTDELISYTKQYTYDLADNRTGFTLTKGGITLQSVAYGYDDLNRLTTVTEDGSLQATYTYDTNGNRASLTYPNGTVESYTYNKANWITSLTNTVNGETVSAYYYTYYASGSQKTKTDHAGKATAYTYDQLGRLKKEVEADPGVELPADGPVFIYLNGAGITVHPITNEISNLETYNLPIPTRTGYTFGGWFVGDTEIVNGELITITESRVAVADWTPNTYTVVYHANGGTPMGGMPPVQNCTYDQDVTILPGFLSREGYNYLGWQIDGTGRIYRNMEVVQNLTAENGGVVNLYAAWEAIGTNAAAEENAALSVASYTAEAVSETPEGLTTCAYTYDASGNRTSLTVTGEETYSVQYSYNANNQLTSEARTENGSTYTIAYSYDANGNLITKSTSAHGETPASSEIYNYNNFDQLVSILVGSTSTVYNYNAQGIRTAKKTPDGQRTAFLLDGGNVVAEVQNNAVTQNYLRGINLIRREAGAATDYYLFNAHGDVVNLVNTAGVATQSYDYDAFGVEKDPDPLDTNHFRYCGEYLDVETGRYYLRARYYDPLIGRFTQRDTHWNTANMIYGDNPQKINEREDKLGLKTYSYAPQISAIVQSGNLYVYGINNPVAYSDRTGNVIESPFDIVTFVISVAEVAANPTNVWAWVGLIGDAVDLIPFITGVGEGVKALRVSVKALDVADDIKDAAKVTDLFPGMRSLKARNLRHNLTELIGKPSGNVQAHHVLPQNFRSKFKAIGINIDNPVFASWVDSTRHLKFSKKYNDAWDAFFKSFGDNNLPTMQQVLDYARKLAKEFDFQIYF